MAVMAFEQFKVRKTEDLRQQDRSLLGYNYDLRFQDPRRPNGHAELGFFTVASTAESMPRVYPDLKALGLRDADIVADLVEFYPNGRRLSIIGERKYTRQGIGTKLFDLILRDANAQSAAVMYVFSTSISMQCFLTNKHGFTPLNNPHGNVFVKLLDAANRESIDLTAAGLPTLGIDQPSSLNSILTP